jgi:serine phosphatase RsbU (regulator of sigma subunit)/pSer/pThr/pTyr-binding forkhead associated (FHA) protein
MIHTHRLRPTIELVSSKTEEIYEIKEADFHIGRLPNLDLFIDDVRVSRPHARIQLRPDGSYDLVDLKSQNGTLLNGKKLTPYQPKRLRDGDLIRIVEHELVFHHQSSVVEQPDDDHTTVLRSLGDLSSDQLVRRSAHPAAALKAILEVVRALGGGADLGEVLGRALDGLMGVFPQAERGFIVTAEDDGTFPLAAFRHRRNHPSPPTLSRTLRDRVLREGQAVLIKDIAGEKFPDKTSLWSMVRSAICVPLQSHAGRTTGMVQLDRLGGHDSFQEQDLDLLAALAIPIGVALENDRLLKERASWAAAQEIQRALLPRVQPQIPGYTFWECYRPAQEVGGDLYDYICVKQAGLSSGSVPPWAVTLGDVAGKGMPAALMMAGICPEVRHLVRSGVPPADVLSRIGRHLFEHGVDGRFVTLLILLINTQTHELTLASAGHLPALIRRSSGLVEAIGNEEAGFPLGILRDARYQSSAFTLEPGDVVLLFSDGMTDAADQSGSPFGLDGLKRELALAPVGAAAVGESILAAVRDHFSGRSQFDDMTLICFNRDPT